MLWNIIYDFYVMHVFGGVSSTGYTQSTLLGAWLVDESDYVSTPLYGLTAITLSDVSDPNYVYNVDIGSYFSFIATIVSMVVILVLCCALIKKIYNICAHVIG